MGWTKQPFVDQETVITANFLNGLQDQIILDEETIEDVESVQKVANAGKTVTIGLNGKLSASGGSGLTDRVKSALLGIFQHVAYADDHGQAYYNELYDALNNIELTGVEATFNQGTMEVYPSTPLDFLKKNLVVKAVYSNGEKVTTDDYTLSGTLQVGTSTVTVTCGDYTDTFDVNVSSVAVTGIECVFNQGTAVIYESDSLTSLKQYLTVKVVYSDGAKEETINYSLSGTLVAGTSTITATYGSFTDTFDVVVSAIAVTSISCTYTQSKTVYDSDSLDVLKSDLAVNAVYSDGSSGTVPSSDYTLSGTLSAGTSTITVSYGGKTDTFSVTVTHQAGTYSVTNNLTNCTNSNGASTVIEGENYSGTITANSGYTMAGATVSVTMSGTDITSTAYNNGTVSIASVSGNIVISASAVAVTLSSISAVFTQGQTVVYDTDSLDVLKPMLVVTATYSDSSTETIPSADYTLSGTLAAGTSTITASYGGKSDTFSVIVEEPLIPSGYTQCTAIVAGNTNSGKNQNEITTDYYANSNTKITVRCKLKATIYSGSWRTASIVTDHSADGYGFAHHLQGSLSDYSIYRGGVSYVIEPTGGISEDAIYNFEFWPNDTVLRNGTVIAENIVDGQKTSGKPMCIFGDTHSDSELYSLKIYEGNTLVADYVPCVRESDSMAGVYDTVGRKFFGNANLTPLSSN